jgi:hypothetical protein
MNDNNGSARGAEATVTPIRHAQPHRDREIVTEVEFEERDGELWRVRTTTSRAPTSRRVCNFMPRVVERVEVHDGSGEDSFRFVLDIQCRGWIERVEIDVSRPLAFVPRVAGLVVEANREKDLHEAIARSAVNAPIVHRYAHTGWIRHPTTGDWVFLHAGGAIGGAGARDGIHATLGERLRHYALPSPPADDEVATVVRGAVNLFLAAASPAVMLPLLATVARAALGSAPSYAVLLSGPTGAGKTSSARLALAFYGTQLAQPDASTLSFAATANALEVIAANANAVPLLIDDYLGTKEHQRIADRIVRAVTGGGRERLRPDTTVRLAPSSNATIIMTGETDLDRASAQARTLTIPVSPSSRAPAVAFRNAQGAARSGLLAQATAAYVQHLAAERDKHGIDTDGMPDRWARDVETVRAKVDAHVALANIDVHPRSVEVVVDLITAFASLLRWTIEVGAFTEAEAKKLVDDAERVLLSLLDDTAFDEGIHAAEMLADALTSHRCHLTNRSGGTPSENAHLLGWTLGSGMYAEARPSGPCVGYVHGDVVDLIPTTIVEVLRDAQRRAGTEPNLTRTRLARLLHEHSWLEKNEGRGTYGTRRQIGNKQIAVWPLPIAVLFPNQ